MVYEDGNGHEHARQEIPFTDLPLNEVTLYACWDGEHWVIMLPSEYLPFNSSNFDLDEIKATFLNRF
jgi:hypothetical protein